MLTFAIGCLLGIIIGIGIAALLRANGDAVPPELLDALYNGDLELPE